MNRNSDQLPKLVLFGTLFSALTASFVVFFQELILNRKNKKSLSIEDKREVREVREEINESETDSRIKSRSMKSTITPEQRMYRLEKDGESLLGGQIMTLSLTFS